MYIHNFESFKNENLSSSQNALDKFGMSDFSKLPIDLIKVLKENSFKKEGDFFIREENKDLSFRIYTFRDEENNKKSYLIGIDIFFFEERSYIVCSTERSNREKIIRFVEDIDENIEIIKKLMVVPNSRKFREGIHNMIKDYNIEIDGSVI